MNKLAYTLSVHNNKQKIEREELGNMNKIKFEETNSKVLNGFWQGVGVGIGIGVTVGGAIILT
ncbi:hypothetical protein IGL98_000183 [Enterococcus sp. DIV0840]